MSHALSARRLRPLLAAVLLVLMLLLPALAAPKATSASKPSKPKAAHAAPPREVAGEDYAAELAALRLLHKAKRITRHPEKATQAQLSQAAHDLALATELEPDFELAPWFHADLGTVFYAQAKAKRGRERRHLLEKSRIQFYLAALTHGINASDGADRTDPSDVTDDEAAGDATASFILYHCGLLEYELGRPMNALTPLGLLLAAAADHKLARPEYVGKARVLLVEVRLADAEEEKRLLAR